MECLMPRPQRVLRFFVPDMIAFISPLLLCSLHLRSCWIRQPVISLPNAYDHTYVPVRPVHRRLVPIRRESAFLAVILSQRSDPLHRLEIFRIVSVVFPELL